MNAISGYPSLDEVVEDFRVQENPGLPTCNAWMLANQLSSLGGAVLISGNLPDACGG